MVVQMNVNESEILPMAAYFKDRNITLRFIEFMDVGNDNGWSLDEVVMKRKFITLHAKFRLEPLDKDYFGEVAKRYHYKNSNAEVGVYYFPCLILYY